jgi:hypothetical protein
MYRRRAGEPDNGDAGAERDCGCYRIAHAGANGDAPRTSVGYCYAYGHGYSNAGSNAQRNAYSSPDRYAEADAFTNGLTDRCGDADPGADRLSEPDRQANADGDSDR